MISIHIPNAIQIILIANNYDRTLDQENERGREREGGSYYNRSHLLMFEGKVYLLSDACDQLKRSPACNVIDQHESLSVGHRQE